VTEQSETTDEKRRGGPPATLFQPGNPGRPKGSKNKLCEDFLGDVLEAWNDKGKQAITDMIDDKPGDFVKMVAGLVPKEMTLNVNDHSEMTDEQLAERIRNLAAQLAPFLIDGIGATSTDHDGEAGEGLAARVH
jgi:hypothetical protein